MFPQVSPSCTEHGSQASRGAKLLRPHVHQSLHLPLPHPHTHPQALRHPPTSRRRGPHPLKLRPRVPMDLPDQAHTSSMGHAGAARAQLHASNETRHYFRSGYHLDRQRFLTGAVSNRHHFACPAQIERQDRVVFAYGIGSDVR